MSLTSSSYGYECVQNQYNFDLYSNNSTNHQYYDLNLIKKEDLDERLDFVDFNNTFYDNLLTDFNHENSKYCINNNFNHGLHLPIRTDYSNTNTGYKLELRNVYLNENKISFDTSYTSDSTVIANQSIISSNDFEFENENNNNNSNMSINDKKNVLNVSLNTNDSGNNINKSMSNLKVNSKFKRKNSKNKYSHRHRFRSDQTEILEIEFSKSHYPNGERAEEIANLLGVSVHTVIVWFQNRRARFKRNCVEISKEEILDN